MRRGLPTSPPRGAPAVCLGCRWHYREVREEVTADGTSCHCEGTERHAGAIVAEGLGLGRARHRLAEVE